MLHFTDAKVEFAGWSDPLYAPLCRTLSNREVEEIRPGSGLNPDNVKNLGKYTRHHFYIHFGLCILGLGKKVANFFSLLWKIVYFPKNIFNGEKNKSSGEIAIYAHLSGTFTRYFYILYLLRYERKTNFNNTFTLITFHN